MHSLRFRVMCGAALLPLLDMFAAEAQEAASVNPSAGRAAIVSNDKQSDQTAHDLEAIVVVGSHIEGAQTTAALPVTVITPEQIAATGAVTGDDLIRTIPQMGNVAFNATTEQQTSNSARGDIASIDLRGSGLGDTLVLLNGRRIVEHPTSQSHGGVPLITYNSEALPTVGLQRVEVLRDGAAAIYGADAVAGVVNFVTRTDFEGVTANAQYGFARGTHREESDGNLFAGHNFADHRGNVSLTLDVYHRTAQLPSDEPYTASQDLRSLFANDAGYSTSSAPDLRSNQGSWASLAALTANGGSLKSPIRQGAVPITTAAGSFHIQPNTLTGCLTQIGNGLCIGKGAVPYSSTANVLRYDGRALDATTIAPDITRQNLSLNAHYDINSNLTVYTENNYYHADSHGLTTQPTTLVPTGVPASNYFNPLGPVTLADGSTNPNRLPGLTNVPASGLPVALSVYRFNDLGPDHVDVSNYQDRFVLGAKGVLLGFNYDSALLYGEAEVKDVSDAVNSTLLANQLALSTPDAYNPFNGGCLDGSGGRDCTPSSKAALDAIHFRLKRVSRSSLTNVDFKLSRADLAFLPGGNIGLAMGVEGRRETHSDTRDPRVSGAVNFTDLVLHTVAVSDAAGVNSTPSTSGSRNVFSAYTELALPFVSPDLGIPLVRKVDVQLAGRYEHYSDFGSVAKPKAALAWDIIDGIRIRASWEQGFKAPNLETTAPFTYARAQHITDWYRCQAALNKGLITNFNACSETYGISYLESGNPALQPEKSQSYNFGIVLQPTFIPDYLGRLTLAVDRWQLRQNGIVGVVGYDTIAVEDYLNRVQRGSGSPNLIRAAPTVDDVAFYAGSGLAPAGIPTVVSDMFKNLQPQTIRGVDVSLAWRLATANLGTFDTNIDATHLDRFYQPPFPEQQALYAARAVGTINPATPLSSPGDQLKVLGNPKWKATATLTWSKANFQVGSSVIHTGATLDTNFLSDSGVPWRVASLTTINLYGQYTFYSLGPLHDLRLRAGARNLFDRNPPLESDGFNGALYQPYGRYIYFSIGASL